MPTSAGLCETCHAPASLKCSGCHNVAYCGKEHQKEDWPKHRTACRAYEVKTSRDLGRHLIAGRDLQVDDVIVCEAPLALGPRHHDAVPISCPGCFRALDPNAEIRCPQCMWPACSANCPGLTDMARHGAECKLFRALATAVKGCRSEILLPLRCLLLQKRAPQKWKLLEEMEHHTEAKQLDSQSEEHLTFLEDAILKPLAFAPGILKDSSSETARRIFALLDVNALELTAPHAGPLAAVYAVTSLLEHSCLPNTRLSFEAPPVPGEENAGHRDWRGRVTVRAAKNIKKGEHLSTMYTHALWSTLARQEHLMAVKNFRCSCPRCLDPRELGTDVGTLKCVACPGWILPGNTAKIDSSDWKCDGGCGAVLTAEEVRYLLDCIANEVEAISDRREQHPTVQKLEELISKLHTLLHPHHQHCLTVQHLLLQAYGAEPGKGGITALKDAELERKAALSRDMLSVILQLDRPLARVALYAAVCFLELERADVEMMKRKLSSGAWNSDRVIRAIIDCRALLRRIMSVLRAEPPGSPAARVAALAEEDDVAIVSWATKKGFKLPEEHQ